MGLRWGLGPVFAYEWLVLSRRWQLYAQRALFVALLGLALTFVWWAKMAGGPLRVRDLARVGEVFFYALVGTQLALVLLAAPAYTAGAICLDKARGTLVHLLVTDLSDAELILGKLASRLLPVLGLALCSLPVLFGAILLGGIDPEAAIGATLITLGVAVLSCTLALALSVWGRKTHEVLLAAYLLLALPILAAPAWSGMLRTPPPSWLILANPFWLAFLPYLQPGTRCLSEQVVFLGVTLTLSAVLVVLAVWRVRVVALRHAGSPRRARRRGLGPTFHLLPGPTLDFNPVLWREWHRQRPSRWVLVVCLLYALVAGGFSLLAVASTVRGTAPRPLVAWTNALQVPAGLLLLSILAVTSLAEERVRGSLEVLLTTPLTTHEILCGKWWATYRLVLMLTVLPALVGLAAASEKGHWEAVLLLICLVLVYGAAVTSLGLALATWIRRLGVALAISVTLLVLLTIVPFLPLLLLSGGPGEDGPALASPFYGPGELTFLLTDPSSSERYWDCVFWDAAWAVGYVVAALLLYLLTLATFDRFLSRMKMSPRRGRFPGPGVDPAGGRRHPSRSAW